MQMSIEMRSIDARHYPSNIRRKHLMRNRLLLFLILLAAGPLVATGAERKPANVIPRPEKMEVREGSFTIGPKTAIVCDPQTRQEAEYLAELLRTPTGFELPIRDAASAEAVNCVVLRTVSDRESLGKEGYELKVFADRVLVEAPTATGVFYAVQTLRQLLPAAVESECLTTGVDWVVPCVEIEDKPRYGWRGLMLDPGHNFLTKEFTKRYIDVMALYKMNRLHWHLTDMGWAIEIKKYPELTNIEKWPAVAPRWRRAYGKCTHGFYSSGRRARDRRLCRRAPRHDRSRDRVARPFQCGPGMLSGVALPELDEPDRDQVDTYFRLSEQLLCRQREDVRVSRRRVSRKSWSCSPRR